ncbi:MAG: agmatinase [Bacteriovoracaceae bacterium]|nr:agmatinase [Bacteriovoracaceae bacterium]
MKEIKTIEELEITRPFISTEKSQSFFSESTHILGVCFDGTTSFRPGSRFGPDAIRDASIGLEDYSPYLDKDLKDFSIYDLGNIPFHPSRADILRELFASYTADLKLESDKIKILTLGGEHSISYSPIKLYLKNYPDLVILHLDAHTDLRDGYLEDDHSHASVIRRVWDHFGKGHQLLQYGIRSGQKSEFDFMQKNKTLSQSLEELCQRLDQLPANRPVYLTLDLDFFDPAYLPGTGTPEAGGETFHGFMKILKILNQKNFVGADIVELAPHIDTTGNSSCFASKVVREVLLAMNKKPNTIK